MAFGICSNSLQASSVIFGILFALMMVVSGCDASSACQVSPVVLVHGGAGNVADSRVPEKIAGVKLAALEGYQVLKRSSSILDAVEAAVKVMEDLPGFNAGRGSVLTLTSEVEMDALITEGKTLNSGAIALAQHVRHPISVARMVMEKTPHAFLGGAGLEDFIKKMGVPRVGDSWLITDRARKALEQFKRSHNITDDDQRPGDVGTVGAVVVDSCGHVASATSTGGINGKYKGRIGDSPQVGSGGYSDDFVGAVSTTGNGEAIMRYNLAHRIISMMEQGASAHEATKLSCQRMTQRMGKTAGAITVSNTGNVGVAFSSNRMSWAYVQDDVLHYGIEHGDNFTEPVAVEKLHKMIRFIGNR